MTRIISFLFCVFLTCTALAQQSKYALFAKPQGDSISFRWQPRETEDWVKGIEQGYDIYRKDISAGTIEKINDSTVIALDTAAWRMHFRMVEDIDSVNIMVLALMFPKEVGLELTPPTEEANGYSYGDNPDDIRFIYHTISCYYSYEAASISGFTFTDNRLQKGRKYEYILTFQGESINNSLASVIISSTDPYLMLPPQGFDDFTNEQHTQVSWAKSDTGWAYFPLYDIYRSEKEKSGFQKMTNTPLLMNDRYVADDPDRAFFRDSTLRKDATYYYKVKAYDLFGEATPLSKPYKVTDRTLLKYAPYILNTTLIKKSYVDITWDIYQESLPEVVNFQLYRSEWADTLFTPITGLLKPDTRTFSDKTPLMDGYYKIMAIGKAQDSVMSDPAYVHIPDTIPPSTPELLEAICDSNGIVTIKWKHGDEQDLYGFKLYTANYKNDEFSRVFGVDSVFTVYHDTISLRSLSKHVYYKIMAHDKSFNPSDFSNIVEVKRYDIIPPNPPVLHSYSSGKEGIKLIWANSTSIDLAYTILFRKPKGATNWETHQVFQKDTNEYVTYLDSATKKGHTYEYFLKAVDDSELESNSSNIFTIKMYDDGFREPIKNISISKSKRKRTIKLAWEYNEFGVEKFLIYRGKDEQRMTILASLKPEEREFYDEKLATDHTYKYRIKAVYDDSGESPYSKEIEVTF